MYILTTYTFCYMENLITVQDRIEYIINDSFRGNLSKAARTLGIKQPTLNDIVIGRRNSPSFDTLSKIVSNAEINIDSNWLILGVGSIHKNETNSNPSQDEINFELENMKNKLIEKMELIDTLRVELSELRLERERLLNSSADARVNASDAQAV